MEGTDQSPLSDCAEHHRSAREKCSVTVAFGEQVGLVIRRVPGRVDRADGDPADLEVGTDFES